MCSVVVVCGREKMAGCGAVFIGGCVLRVSRYTRTSIFMMIAAADTAGKTTGILKLCFCRLSRND